MVVALSFMLGWIAYILPALIVGVREAYRRRGSDEEIEGSLSSEELPSFSLIVPMKDEEEVAGRILPALMEADYPPDKYEVIVVDDLSSDDTPEICMRFQDMYPGRIKYLYRDVAFGKPSALNYGLKYADGEIIGLFDADNVPQPDFLLKTARHLTDKDVVCVQGLLSSINAEENLLTKFLHYESLLNFEALLSGKEKLGLFVPFAGTCVFIRRQVLEEVGGWQDEALAEDLELSGRLLENGYHVKFAPDIKSKQENPHSFRDLMRQRVRWFRGCLEVALKYGSLLKHLNWRSLDAEVTFTGPLVMVFVFLTYLFNLLHLFHPVKAGIPIFFLTQCLTFLTLTMLFFLGVGLAYATKPRRISNVKWLPCLYLYWTTQVFAAVYAFLQMILKRPKRWTKTPHKGTIDEQKPRQ